MVNVITMMASKSKSLLRDCQSLRFSLNNYVGASYYYGLAKGVVDGACERP